MLFREGELQVRRLELYTKHTTEDLHQRSEPPDGGTQDLRVSRGSTLPRPRSDSRCRAVGRTASTDPLSGSARTATGPLVYRSQVTPVTPPSLARPIDGARWHFSSRANCTRSTIPRKARGGPSERGDDLRQQGVPRSGRNQREYVAAREIVP